VSAGRPLVSVCIPAYNAERWIAGALESALEQSYDELEVVVADNASTDATAEIASGFDDARIRVESAGETIGAVANHNRAIQLSHGAFVKFLHADDLLLPTCVEEMVTLALEDERIGLVFAPRKVVVEQAPDPEWGELFGRPHEYFEQLERVNDGRRLFGELLEAGFEANWVGEPSAVLLTREALEHVGLLNERLFQIADLELWARIMVVRKVGFVDQVLSIYRHHGESGTARNALSKRDWFDPTWLFEGLVRIPELTPEERARVVSLRRMALLHAFRAQVGRLVTGRLTGDLPRYLGYRARASLGQAPILAPSLLP
jgi:glycosyltransferase involved in cell wall biosynthesis